MRRLGQPERGAAIVEFATVFLVLVVPLVYAIALMADVQRAVLGTSSAAREVGRVYVTAPDRAEAERRAGVAWREVLANYGFDARDGRAGLVVTSRCPVGAPPGCGDGFGPGAEVEVVASLRVPVTRIPFLGLVAGPDVPVRATHHTRVDRFRGLR
jgi:hypothetical protein